MEQKKIKTIRILALITLILLVTLILGIAMNKSVKSLNGGRMPVQTSSKINTYAHFNYIESSEVNAPFLTDKYYIGKEHNIIAFSLGDVLIYFGGYGFIIMAIINGIFMSIFAIKLVKERKERKWKNKI